jgi:Ca2+:H+ antiporter
VLAGVLRYASGVSQVLAFVVATIALAGLAWIVSFATEQVGQRFGSAVTGVMQSTLGNLPEFFVVIFALNAHQLVVAQTAILGSILVNALLVLGLVIVAGALRQRDGLMRFSPRLPNDTATLLLLATFIIVLIGLANATHDAASHHTKGISIIGAFAILIVYGLWVRGYLRSDTQPAEEIEAPQLSTATSVVLLGVAGVASAFVSDWFVYALQPTIDTLHISEAFAGLVIVAIAGTRSRTSPASSSRSRAAPISRSRSSRTRSPRSPPSSTRCS